MCPGPPAGPRGGAGRLLPHRCAAHGPPPAQPGAWASVAAGLLLLTRWGLVYNNAITHKCWEHPPPLECRRRSAAGQGNGAGHILCQPRQCRQGEAATAPAGKREGRSLRRAQHARSPLTSLRELERGQCCLALPTGGSQRRGDSAGGATGHLQHRPPWPGAPTRLTSTVGPARTHHHATGQPRGTL